MPAPPVGALPASVDNAKLNKHLAVLFASLIPMETLTERMVFLRGAIDAQERLLAHYRLRMTRDDETFAASWAAMIDVLRGWENDLFHRSI
jgi:hypothetical protein